MRPFLAAALALIASSAFAQEPADFKAGEKIEILFGGKWYPGAVLEAGAGKWKVHYDGYGDSWDTWLGPDKIRKRVGGAAPAADPKAPQGPAPAPGGDDPVVGEVCEGIWGTSWYEVEIVAVENGKYKVRWRGYGEKFDLLARDQIRRKGEEKEILPRKGREGDGGGLPPAQMVGKEVEVFWHGTWWKATVTGTDGKRLKIRYAKIGENIGGLQEEWAVAERVRPPGSAARYTVDPASVPGRKGLSGLWYRYVKMGAGAVRREHFIFYPDGRLYHGFPMTGVDVLDFAQCRLVQPECCGGYGIEGDRLNVAYGGDADEKRPMTFEKVSDDQIKLNGLSAFRAGAFADGERLAGVWKATTGASRDAIAPGTALTGGHTITWTFREDGTFAYDEIYVMATEGGDAQGKRENHLTGRYRLFGQTLEQKNDAGQTSHRAIYPCWKKGEPKERFVEAEREFVAQP